MEGSVRQREENPFSFKHFLKRDSSMSSSFNNNPGGSTNSTHHTSSVSHSSSSGSNNICHSRSTSIINGADGPAPSKSATTSSLNQSQNTGARPKIPQFQSVHALASGQESKMKRSPRFPSFDSQSSLSELSDERSNLFHSRSNSSFNSDYPVQRSFSTYEIESPTTESAKYDRKLNTTSSASPSQPHHNYTGRGSTGSGGVGGGNRIGATEFSAALPDFVQDHLVMEQWYHGLGSGSPKSTSPVSVDFDHLPDFTINNLDGDLGVRQPPGNLSYVDLNNDIPFEINLNSNHNRTPPRAVRNPSPIIPLDLPRQNEMEGFRREQAPPDLPPDITEGQRGAFGYGGSDMNRDQSSDKIQTLPDFLSDGPIHSSQRLADVTQDTPHFNSPDENSVNTVIARLQQENDRLRNELDDCRQIIINQTCRISELEHMLIEERRSMMSNFGGNSNSSKNNNNNSGKPAGGKTAEGTSAGGDCAGSSTNGSDQSAVSKLKQQVKELNADVEALKRENQSLKEEGAVGGAGPRVPRTQQLSRDLRLAASTAESNLR